MSKWTICRYFMALPYIGVMKVLQFKEKDAMLTQSEIPVPLPDQDEIVVDLRAAAFNRRDYWIMKGMYPNVDYPVVPGGDGAGYINDREVVIDAGINWGSNENVQAQDYYLVGSPGQGTFAQHIAVPRANVYDKPPHLTLQQAAALPIAGVTAYRVLFSRGQLQSGESVLITGAGGGVAITAVQFALAAGARVYVTSSSDEKIAKAIALGASGGVNYKHAVWHQDLKGKAGGGFDLIVDSAGGDNMATLLKIANPGARIVMYGGSLGKMNNISPQILFWRQISILGSSMGSPADFRAMLEFVSKHKIVPVVDRIYNFGNAQEAIGLLESGEQFGKLILEIPA